MRKLIYSLIVLLALLHQDFWWWDRIDPLLFGFIPIGLTYHACVSVAAAVLWGLAVRHCWPTDVDVDHETLAPRASSSDRGHA